MKKIFVATSTFAQFSRKPVHVLKKEKLEIKFNHLSRKLSEEELIDQAKDATAIIAGPEKYSKNVFGSLNNLKVISRLGVGLDNIDLNYAKKKI